MYFYLAELSKKPFTLYGLLPLLLLNTVKSYVVKQPQEKWACDFHDDAPPMSFQLQVAEVIFYVS